MQLYCQLAPRRPNRSLHLPVEVYAPRPLPSEFPYHRSLRPRQLCSPLPVAVEVPAEVAAEVPAEVAAEVPAPPHPPLLPIHRAQGRPGPPTTGDLQERWVPLQPPHSTLSRWHSHEVLPESDTLHLP